MHGHRPPPVQLEGLRSKFDEHRAAGVRTFLVDFDGVSYVNSTALALLVRLKKDAQAAGAELQLINVARTVMDILRTTRLHTYFFGEDEL